MIVHFVRLLAQTLNVKSLWKNCENITQQKRKKTPPPSPYHLSLIRPRQHSRPTSCSCRLGVRPVNQPLWKYQPVSLPARPPLAPATSLKLISIIISRWTDLESHFHAPFSLSPHTGLRGLAWGNRPEWWWPTLLLSHSLPAGTGKVFTLTLGKDLVGETRMYAAVPGLCCSRFSL